MKLSPKQWRIIELVSEGLKNKEIAPLVGRSELSIKNMLREIFDETGMNNRLELALWYVSREEREHNEKKDVVDCGNCSISHVCVPSAAKGTYQDHV